MMRLTPLQEKEETSELPLSLPGEDRARRQLSASQEEPLPVIKLANILILDFLDSRTGKKKFL